MSRSPEPQGPAWRRFFASLLLSPEIVPRSAPVRRSCQSAGWTARNPGLALPILVGPAGLPGWTNRFRVRD